MVAAVTAAVITAAGAAYSAHEMSRAGKKGRKWQQRAIDEQRRQYEQTRQDWAPWREAGVRAIGQLEDPSAFQTSPGYEFIRDEGIRDVENLYSVRGGGGNAMKALADWNKRNAATEYWNWRNDRRAMAGLGTTGTVQTQAAGQNYANAFGRAADNMTSMGYYDAMNRTDAVNAGLSALTYGMQRYAGRQQTPLTGVNVVPMQRSWNAMDMYQGTMKPSYYRW